MYTIEFVRCTIELLIKLEERITARTIEKSQNRYTEAEEKCKSHNTRSYAINRFLMARIDYLPQHGGNRTINTTGLDLILDVEQYKAGGEFSPNKPYR